MYDNALKLLNEFYSNGFNAYIVGGFVRDKLLNLDNKDIDIITDAKVFDIQKIFNIEIIDNYGSFKLKYNNYIYDVTTFRKEYYDYTDRRPKKVEFIKDVKEDLYRRDFTINAILIDRFGNYIDYFNAIDDINNKIIKMIGDPNNRLKEDPLRILRAFRFMTLYNLSLDDKLLQSIDKNKYLINNISFDRIKSELDIIFSSKNSYLFFDMIDKLNLYEILNIRPKNRVIYTDNYLLTWSQLDYSSDYNFSNKEKKYINDIRNIVDNDINSYTVYKYDVGLLLEANKILNKDIDINKLKKELIIKNRNQIDISYNELLKIIKDKNKINEIYIDLEKHILYNKIRNTKEDIISYLEGDNSEQKSNRGIN